jgi:hypothetical protein
VLADRVSDTGLSQLLSVDFAVWSIWGALLHDVRLMVVPKETFRRHKQACQGWTQELPRPLTAQAGSMAYLMSRALLVHDATGE